jgi:gliding motility-associated-like protein
VGDLLYINPPELSSFRRNKYYEQLLQTNAEAPQFFIVSGEFPEGLLLHSNGIINGIPPLLGQYKEKNYTFTVEVLDSYGCTTTQAYSLNGEFYISTVFSPNGDGLNDYFMKGYKVIIFDRFGRKIHEGEDGWDGRYKGKEAPVDTYFYVLFYRNVKGKEFQEKGSITLVR